MTVDVGWKFWITPCDMRSVAATRQIGRSTHSVQRVRSTQKLPIVFALARAMPRMRAMASAMPTAAETKLWNVRPTICVKCDIVDSPLYACQFVFVVNETAVFQARSGANGSHLVGIERQQVLDALDRRT